MDYEIKYVITIFLLVKVAALPLEFSISEKKEKSEQNNGPVKGPLAAPLAAEEISGPSEDGAHWGPHFIWDTGVDKLDQMRVFGVRDDPKSEKVKETPISDICENKIQTLGSTLKWRNIKKTLRWLNRVLSSNNASMELCGKRKIHKSRINLPNMKITNYDFHQSANTFSKRKKTKLGQRLGEVEPSFGQKKKIKRKHQYKHKSWRNYSKNESKKPNTSWRKKFSHSNLLQPDASITSKPNSVLLDFERILPEKTKSGNDCPNANTVKRQTNCVGRKNSKTSQVSEERSRQPEATGNNPERKLPKPKTKPWPHFVYHRVSSNFGHRQSAYVAISVATSSKPETTDNNA